MEQFLRPPLCLPRYRPPTYLHLPPGFSLSSHPASPPQVPSPRRKLIPRAQPLSHPASLHSSLYMFASLGLWPVLVHLSQTQTVPREPTHCCLRCHQRSPQKWGVTHGALSPSPSNLLGCQKTMTLTLKKRCANLLLSRPTSRSWSPAAGKD